MLNPDMIITDAFVKAAFNSAEHSLNVEQLESIGVAVHINVSTLLEHYTPRGGDQSAFPFEAASMLARVIGPLSSRFTTGSWRFGGRCCLRKRNR